MADQDFLKRIKRLAIVAIASDDMLMQHLLLKGGNLLDVVYGISARASVDLDFSTAEAFDLTDLRRRVSNALTITFEQAGFVAFDVKVEEKPRSMLEELREFWGGYEIAFKLITKKKHDELGGNLEKIRRNAERIGKDNSTVFPIQISNFEHCEPKERHELDGYTIYTYAPLLVVCEKLRTICQQRREYVEIVGTHRPRARARDFVDIWVVMDRFQISRDTSFASTLRAVFAAKRVPLILLGTLDESRAFHSEDFYSVQATVNRGVILRDFDFYVDFAIGICNELKPFWNV